MNLVPLCPEVWTQYVELVGGHPPPPQAAVFVEDEGEIIAGVGIYGELTPYLFAEHLTLKSTLGVKKRGAAMQMLINGVRGYATIRARTIIVVASIKGIQSMLTKAGYQQTAADVFQFMPRVPELKKKEPAAATTAEPAQSPEPTGETKVTTKKKTVKRRKRRSLAAE